MTFSTSLLEKSWSWAIRWGGPGGRTAPPGPPPPEHCRLNRYRLMTLWRNREVLPPSKPRIFCLPLVHRIGRNGGAKIRQRRDDVLVRLCDASLAALCCRAVGHRIGVVRTLTGRTVFRMPRRTLRRTGRRDVCNDSCQTVPAPRRGVRAAARRALCAAPGARLYHRRAPNRVRERAASGPRAPCFHRCGTGNVGPFHVPWIVSDARGYPLPGGSSPASVPAPGRCGAPSLALGVR